MIRLRLLQLDLIEIFWVLQQHLTRGCCSSFQQGTPIHFPEEIVPLYIAEIFGTKAFTGIFMQQLAN